MRAYRNEQEVLQGARRGDDVIAAGWIGLAATVLLAEQRDSELRSRFSIPFIEEAKRMNQHRIALPGKEFFLEAPVHAVYPVVGGGIYRALWYLAQDARVGLEIQLRSIPVKQHTVELCEFYRLSPYQILSGGCLLMATPHGTYLMSLLREAGIPSAWIGNCVSGVAKRVVCGDRTTYLDRPGPDEIEKFCYCSRGDREQ